MGGAHVDQGATRVLVVGSGMMGAMHARAIGGTRATLCGVVDRRQEAADAVGQASGVPGFTDLAEAIEQTRPTVAIIATPDPAHRASAEAAIDAGLHVLVEKPLATTVEDAEAMIDRAAERGVRLMPGHSLRFDHRHIEMAEAVRSGRTGAPLLIDAQRWIWASFGATRAADTNPLWYVLIHDIDLIQWIGGGTIAEIDSARAISAGDAPQAFVAGGRLNNGVAFQLSGGWTLPDGVPNIKASVEVHATAEHVRLDAFHQGLTFANGVKSTDGEGMDWPVVYGAPAGLVRRELHHFFDALETGAPLAVPPEAALEAVRSAVALEAAATRHTVAV